MGQVDAVTSLKMQKVQGMLALVCLICIPFIVPLSSVLSLSKQHRQKRDIQCGLNAPPGQEMCRTGMCCSRYGFCGSTDEYCGLGCQGNCRETTLGQGHAPEKFASCPGTTSMNRSIAYYESWASHRACDIYMPSDIDPTPYTHINFAFALIDKDTSKVALSLQNDTILYDQMKKLRTASNHLQIWIAVGGYAVGAAPFSKLAASSTGRGAFVDSVCSFMDKYGFDGMDLDWEYPGATDMGGAQSDGANLVLLLKEYRAKCKNKGLSVTVPGGIFYMTGFNLQGIEPYVDWLNVMTYDLHGSWEKPTLAQPHTNLSDITQSLKNVWDAKINPQKVIMGLAFYGKTYTLSSGSCAQPGCAAKGPGNAGACSNEAGSLYNSEIEELLSKDSSIKPVLDKNAAVKYFTWNKDQWVSYDDAETRKLKMEYAAQNCLGGTLSWAVDMSSLGDPKDGLGL